MATLTPSSSPDMSIAIKIVLARKDENRKFKLPLKELGANSLPDKVRLTFPLAAFSPCSSFRVVFKVRRLMEP